MAHRDTYIAGVIRKAHADKGYAYGYFLPSWAPRNFVANDPKLARLLEEATHKLGELNAYARFVPDIDFFIHMHETKEATASNKIEGTHTSIDEALMREEDIVPERRNDWREVQNYIRAMGFAIEQLKTLPVSTRLLNATHKILLTGVRGSGKQPGSIRKSQNWIGGATLKDARFIPPDYHHVPELLTDLEKFLNDDDSTLPLLIKAGIAHYQFETIHPYLDGNGRIGRLLIILYLIDQKMLDKPVLYLSQFFEKHRQAYYDALDIVRSKNDLEQWLKFFLVGVSETAQKAVDTLQAIIQLKENDHLAILGLGKRAQRAGRLLNYLYTDPVITVADVAKELAVTAPTANALVSDMQQIGILKEITGFSRNRIFIYESYIRLFSDSDKGEEAA
ncbi:cell filamentation protein Fic [Candidatus Saccharibacteria bacterium RIFCSPHIGHO2_02_FULL_47_12]|nr:MAG: cell filamentation protein Fic [Candidatus Saccharibacteria bacterium RIFCSPHIGHO2_02_FULL_47_12]